MVSTGKQDKSLHRILAVALVLLMILTSLSPFLSTAVAAETEVQSETVYDASYISFAPGADETKHNFSWYSPKTDVPGVIEYAKVTDGNPETAKTVTATLATASSGYQANEATITDLESSSEYIYRLGDGNGKWTETYSFKTHQNDSYNFLFTGDPQIGSSGNIAKDTEGWVNTLTKALEKFPNTSFIQSAGDQVIKQTLKRSTQDFLLQN